LKVKKILILYQIFYKNINTKYLNGLRLEVGPLPSLP